MSLPLDLPFVQFSLHLETHPPNSQSCSSMISPNYYQLLETIPK